MKSKQKFEEKPIVLLYNMVKQEPSKWVEDEGINLQSK